MVLVVLEVRREDDGLRGVLVEVAEDVPVGEQLLAGPRERRASVHRPEEAPAPDAHQDRLIGDERGEIATASMKLPGPNRSLSAGPHSSPPSVLMNSPAEVPT